MSEKPPSGCASPGERSNQQWIVQGYFPNAYRLNPLVTRSPYRIPEADIAVFDEKRRARSAPVDVRAHRLAALAEEEQA
ncbi:MAG TPA: hypothetical protein DEP84_21665 [Chloroflexi bacterium]|nr:hypothetical protein [Chloroflexota bacterium]